MAFSIFLLTIGAMETTALTILYYLICRVIYKTSKFDISDRPAESQELQDSSTNSKNQNTSRSGIENESPFSTGVHQAVPTDDSTNSYTALHGLDKGNKNVEKVAKRERLTSRKIKSSRVTIMFMVITIAFANCFVPKLALMVLESANKEFWVQLSDKKLGGFMFLYSVYIFNNFINQFIYSFMDKKFQNEMKKICCNP